VKRMMAALVVTVGAWMGLVTEAQAQVLITPTGPMSVRTPALSDVAAITANGLECDKFYPGRTMGGGPRILRSNPPPSSLKRREE
jgi:hypothetical protein